MSMLLHFTMLSDESDGFLREYEVPYDFSMFDLHCFICSDLKHDPNNMCSFFTADGHWEKGQEFTAFDVGNDYSDFGAEAPLPMEKVLLGKVARQKRDRLIYVFDPLNDRALFLEVMGARKCNDECRPRVVSAKGEAPDPFEPGMVESASIFEDAMDEFSSFEGEGDAYDDDF